jgi:hypothetical protein
LPARQSKLKKKPAKNFLPARTHSAEVGGNKRFLFSPVLKNRAPAELRPRAPQEFGAVLPEFIFPDATTITYELYLFVAALN